METQPQKNNEARETVMAPQKTACRHLNECTQKICVDSYRFYCIGAPAWNQDVCFRHREVEAEDTRIIAQDIPKKTPKEWKEAGEP